MGWQMYDLTHDPFKIGMIGLAAALPALSLALFSGYLVDRFNPLRLYQVVVLVSMCSVLNAWHATTPIELYWSAFMTGMVRSFSSPSMNAIIPRIISRNEIKRSSAYTTLAFHFAGVLGPGLAGVLLGLKGYSFPYLLCLSALLMASLCLWLVDYRHDDHVSGQPPHRGRFVEELMVGVRFVAKTPMLLTAMSLDMFAVLFGGVTAMLPVFAAEVLHVGPEGLGWLRAAPALGAMMMGLHLIRRPIGEKAGRMLFVSILGFGLCILVFGISKNFWLSLVALALSGALDSISMVIRGAIVQLCSPEGMRGRIAAVNAVFIGSSNEIGEFESGTAARLFGTIPSVIFGGCMTLLTVTLMYLKSRELRTLDLTQLEKRSDS